MHLHHHILHKYIEIHYNDDNDDDDNIFFFYNKSQQDALLLNFILVKNSTCFGQTYCP
jgi:hypothetical protein